MSERGSVCSEYFYCTPCAIATEAVFRKHYEYVTAVMVPASANGPESEPYPIIIVGKSRCGWSGEELFEFGGDVAEDLSKVLCHDARFAVIADSSNEHGIARVTPGVEYATWLAPSKLGEA